MKYFKRLFFKIIKKSPADMPMVQYWKNKDKVEAKLFKNKDGLLVMQMFGEKEVFPGFPRGHILFGKISKLKHEVKNQIFNESWKLLEDGLTDEAVVKHVKTVLPKIYDILDSYKYDIVPYEKLVPSVKEIYRAWTKVAPSPLSLKLRDILCHVLQEDDGYRFRVQWLVKYFNPNRWFFFGNPIRLFDSALKMIEIAEVIGDMKERMRLLRRVLLSLLEDKGFKSKFLAFCKEVDWKKVQLTKADAYFFRGKYFKVDLDTIEY